MGPWAVVFGCCASLARFPDFAFQDCSAENVRQELSIKSNSVQFSLKICYHLFGYGLMF